MGVKSLWKLLEPVGRPVMLETLEGQILAIDSSIWIYQFQATMRGKDGRALLNAHVLGFLRRIAKLLFFGIRPVFVFDGGAPALKRNTINERKKKKAGAAMSHAKLAEKLLAAQMRREALKHAGASSSTPPRKGAAPVGPVVLDDTTVYLEDIDPSVPKASPAKSKPAASASASPVKPKFYDHDPYRLPELDLDAAVNKATRAEVPDARLATEEELRDFIEDMRPDDFDVTSPAFRELPTEVQYEIVGDLRLKSRQTSYLRLQNMLRSSKTPLDFSKQQILNLQQRNTLTQQLLSTTDLIGTGPANIVVPVRIASERNREYVLVKNEGKDGGWILGIRDDGTREKPIEIDHESVTVSEAVEDKEEDDEDDEDMEEVEIPPVGIPDPDLLEYQRSLNLTAIESRHRSRPQRSMVVSSERQTDELATNDEDNDELAWAIQESLKDAAISRQPAQELHPAMVNAVASSSKTRLPEATQLVEEDTFVRGNRLETTLSIASGSFIRSPQKASSSSFGESVVPTTPLKDVPRPISKPPSVPLPASSGLRFGAPFLLRSPEQQQQQQSAPLFIDDDDDDDDDDNMETALPSFAPEIETIETIEDAVELMPALDAPATRLSSPEDSFDIAQPSPPAPRPVTPMETRPPTPIVDRARSITPVLDWSRSPSPTIQERIPSPVAEEWDAAQEMDAEAEEGDFAQFVSQVKGKNLDEVQREIDEEIKALHAQKRAAMRDSDDINQQMITQIMMLLSLFGIPYITAPMEAEAQCAVLVQLGLVSGIITDDSDVFLFGGPRVYRNMFNQTKTVECFLLADLERELGLEQDALIRLAYLLGSDYVDGLPGVGPVVAMELLGEFPGSDGLFRFKEWWMKVQSGKDSADDNQSAFRKRFASRSRRSRHMIVLMVSQKKNFKELYLPPEWPNSKVRDAYYHPTVDESDEPFKWGFPDLDALREFLRAELGWGPDKVDDLLLPIIQKIRKRGQSGLNKQGNLNTFLDVSGSGTIAPRQRQAYTSKRLQKVVSDFRKKGRPAEGADSGSEDREPPKKRIKTKKAAGKGKKSRSKKISEDSDGEGDEYRDQTTLRSPMHITLLYKDLCLSVVPSGESPVWG
ncbi:unnamed protein product [Mycena citricolor]|uniref:PIN domain-like protein n=1 Tax=Mycena citricolor TaxID=2018698 RepID=A0AAD2Q2D5_9AGAR|nr:unnamed protein product [Mycena citricolor]